MKFLYATDGSEGAKAGATFLSRLPLTTGDEINILTVIQDEEARGAAQPILADAKETLQNTGATIKSAVRRGNAALEILDAIRWAAEETPSDCIVVGTRGLSAIARFFLGSVAERAARMSPCPVLVAQPSDPVKPVSRVVIGFDGSRGARRAVTFVEKMPLPADAEICLVTVVTPKSRFGFLPGGLAQQVEAMADEERREAAKALHEIAAALKATGRTVTTEIRDSDPAEGLMEAAREREADLIAVGALGLSEVERFLIGSVADKVLRHAPCSVLIVRPYPGME
jgi:nucleotide-binding universal stress UspA family protein